MIVFPVKSAGAILPTARSKGKFHGTMAVLRQFGPNHDQIREHIPPHTPSGIYSVYTVFSSSSNCSVGMSKEPNPC
jgi:hypothetical protein